LFVASRRPPLSGAPLIGDRRSCGIYARTHLHTALDGKRPIERSRNNSEDFRLSSEASSKKAGISLHPAGLSFAFTFAGRT
jgi:hypothetical protein